MCSSLAQPVALRALLRVAAEHTLTISGYNLLKGSGSCDPVSSARFTVAGHEWVSSGCRQNPQDKQRTGAPSRSSVEIAVPCTTRHALGFVPVNCSAATAKHGYTSTVPPVGCLFPHQRFAC